MTNEELKKKICDIIAPYVSAYGDDERIADALIAAGIGDLKEHRIFAGKDGSIKQLYSCEEVEQIAKERDEYKHRADKAERALHILAKNALYSVMQSDGAFVKLCYGADTAKCNACNEKCSTDDVTDEMLAECLVTESLKQAEKELAEEGKNEQY